MHPGSFGAQGWRPARVEIFGLGGWLAWRLGSDPRDGVTARDWLAAPWQRLAEVTAAPSFIDGTGGLTRARAALSWYPPDLWRYVLSCQWSRIAEEEAFPGRCAEAGDELGSAVVTARLARDLMRLWLAHEVACTLGHPAAPGSALPWPRRWRPPAGPRGSGSWASPTGSPPKRTTGSASPNPSTPVPATPTAGPTRSSTPGVSPPPCPGAIAGPQAGQLPAGRSRGPGHRLHAGAGRSPLPEGGRVGIWYLIEICRSWGSMIPRPNVGVSSG